MSKGTFYFDDGELELVKEFRKLVAMEKRNIAEDAKFNAVCFLLAAFAAAALDHANKKESP
jgi:hypothetical protein